MDVFERLIRILQDIEHYDIQFKKHFYEKCLERPISEDMARNYLRDAGRLLKVEEQTARYPNEEKFKIWLKMSSKYSLVLIISIQKKSLYIVTGWNSNRKWQK